MLASHPNIDLLNTVNIADIQGSAHAFHEDVVWHFINPELPEMEGDYRGVAGVQAFFAGMAGQTGGTFRVNPVDARAIGDELVVVQTRNEMTVDETSIAVDVVLVWRFVDGKIKEVWDIPAVYTAQQDKPIGPAAA